MTFKQFEQLFHSKYPDGQCWMHDEFEHDVPGRRQKVAVVFAPNGKVYKYAGAYEDVLCKIGVPTISKQRMDNLEANLKNLQATDGKADEFFGIMVDNSAEIARLTAEIEQIKATHVVVGRVGD